MRAALSAGGLFPWHTDLLEMHGTGTPLGDPIETIAALSVYMAEAKRQQQLGASSRAPLAMTSLKSHVGHAEPAAGGCRVRDTLKDRPT